MISGELLSTWAGQSHQGFGRVTCTLLIQVGQEHISIAVWRLDRCFLGPTWLSQRTKSTSKGVLSRNTLAALPLLPMIQRQMCRPGLVPSDPLAWKACATGADGHGIRWTRLLTSYSRPAIHPPTKPRLDGAAAAKRAVRSSIDLPEHDIERADGRRDVGKHVSCTRRALVNTISFSRSSKPHSDGVSADIQA